MRACAKPWSGRCCRLAQHWTGDDEREQVRRNVQNRVGELLDAWMRVVAEYDDVGLKYQDREPPSHARGLLRDMLDQDQGSVHQRKFRVNRSLRDVEPGVNLFVRGLDGRWLEDAP